MTITAKRFEKLIHTSVVTVESDLSDPWFYWFVNGRFAGKTRSPSYSVYASTTHPIVQVYDSTDGDVAPDSITPAHHASVRRISFLGSTNADVARYIVQYRKSGGSWVTFATVYAPDQGATARPFTVVSPELDEDSTYDFQVIAIDSAGNEASALQLYEELIVRRPDSVNWSAEYNTSTNRVTFDAA